MTDTNIIGENDYQCAQCHNVYEKTRSDEVAAKESVAKFGMEVTPETHAVICDDCFQMMFGQ